MARRIPYATIALALVGTGIYVLRVFDGDAAWAQLSARWALLYSQPWRIVSSPFLHHDLPHYFFNVVFLLLFGWQVEQSMGGRTLLAVFFGAMVTGHFGAITLTHTWIVGISGGVCGLFGYSLTASSRQPQWKTLSPRPLQLLYFLHLTLPLVPFVAEHIDFPVAHMNHLVGIVYGLAYGFSLSRLSHSRWLHRGVAAFPLLLFATLSYSPWQAEWRLARSEPVLVTATANCRTSSMVQETYVPVVTTFANRSRQAVGVYWLDYEANASFYSWLAPGGKSTENTFIGNAWCVVAAESGEAIQVVTVTEPGQIVIVRQGHR